MVNYYRGWWLHVCIFLKVSLPQCIPQVLFVFVCYCVVVFLHYPQRSYCVGTLCGPSKVISDSRPENMLPRGEAALYIYSPVHCHLLACHVLVHHRCSCCRNLKSCPLTLAVEFSINNNTIPRASTMCRPNWEVFSVWLKEVPTWKTDCHSCLTY